MKTDLLVIGTGIAGLSYAIKAALQAPDYRIIVIAKDALRDTNTKTGTRRHFCSAESSLRQP